MHMMRNLMLFGALILGNFSRAQIVINEVDYDQLSTDDGEYLEIRNIGTSDWPMSIVSVLMYNGQTGTPELYRTIADPNWPDLAPLDFFVICTSSTNTPNCDHVATPATNLIQNGPTDAIALVTTQNPNPVILDVVSYGGSLAGYVEGTGTTFEDSNDVPGISIGRFVDGYDTQDNSADFYLMCSTPGAANVIDPMLCDLSTSIRTASSFISSFSVLPLFGGNGLMVFDANMNGEPLTYEVFGADGSLLANRAASTAVRNAWALDAADLRGRLLLVRLTTPTRQETRRIVLP